MRTIMTVIAVQLLMLCASANAQENCYNGIDDDNDGLIDLNDPDCLCSGMINSTETFISNPSFEDLSNCPTNYSQLANATGWEQASYGTSDYLNTCGFVFPQFQQSSVLPFPDGSGATGGFVLSNYKEYVGSVLNTPLHAGVTYNLELTAGLFGMIYYGDTLSPIQQLGSIQFTLFGAASSFDFPFTGYSAPPSGAYQVLGTATLMPDAGYQELTIVFTPTVDLEVLVMGPPEVLPAAYPGLGAVCYPYYVLDKLEMNENAPIPAPAIVQTGSDCANSLLLSVSNPIPATQGQWYKAGVAIVGQTTPNLAVSTLGLGAGDYQFLSYTANGCVQSEFTVLPEQIPTIANSTLHACAGEQLELAGISTMQNSWYNANSELLSTGTTWSFSVNASTTLTHIVTNNGCSDTAVVTIDVPNVQFETVHHSVCKNTSVVLENEMNATANWFPINGLDVAIGASVLALVDQEITYVANFNVAGCPATQSFHLIPLTVSYAASFHVENDQLILEASPVTNEYSWSLPENTTFGGANVETQLPEQTSTINIMLMVNSPEGCTDTAQYAYFYQKPVVDSSAMVFVPNVFTPNGDGINSVFAPVFSSEVDAYELTIYNRWGEIIFHSDDVSNGWDGTFKGQTCSDGTYTWIVQYGLASNAMKYHLNGSVSLFK